MIRYDTAKLVKSFNTASNAVGCKNASLFLPQIKRDGTFDKDVGTVTCGEAKACGLKEYVTENRADFERVRETLASRPTPDRETTVRIAALRELYRKPKADFNRKACFRSGDVIITHECPSEMTIITKNGKHINPVAAVLGKSVRAYGSADDAVTARPSETAA